MKRCEADRGISIDTSLWLGERDSVADTFCVEYSWGDSGAGPERNQYKPGSRARERPRGYGQALRRGGGGALVENGRAEGRRDDVELLKELLIGRGSPGSLSCKERGMLMLLKVLVIDDQQMDIDFCGDALHSLTEFSRWPPFHLRDGFQVSPTTIRICTFCFPYHYAALYISGKSERGSGPGGEGV